MTDGAVEHVDVLIVTAIKLEYDAVLHVNTGAVLGSTWESRPGPTGLDVAFRTFHTPDGGTLRFAATYALEMGGVATATAAAPLVKEYKPQCLAMCGVCAGRKGDVNLGDVIIGDRLWTYDTGARVVEKQANGRNVKRFRADPFQYNLHPRWKQHAERFQPSDAEVWLLNRPRSYDDQGDWLLSLLFAKEDPVSHREQEAYCKDFAKVVTLLRARKYLKGRGLSLTTKGHAYISDKLLLHLNSLPQPKPFTVHVGAIGTGTAVVRDAHIFDKLSERMRKTIGLEMEASAIGAVAQLHDVRAIVMKGVMDFADPEKNDNFKYFAARAAAECLIDFLRHSLPPRDSGHEIIHIGAPTLSSVSTDIFKRYVKGLLDSQWTKIRPVLHRSASLDVRRLYVELFVIDEKTLEQVRTRNVLPGEPEDAVSARAPRHFLTAESLLARTSGRSVIVGAPGSGKTTLIKWACAYLLEEAEHRGIYPLPVRLRGFAEALRADSSLSLPRYALDFVGNFGATDKQHLIRVLTSDEHSGTQLLRPFFFLLDGWDEVPLGMREQVIAVINRETYGIPTIVTTRQSGMPELLRDEATVMYELGALTDAAVAELCSRYGGAYNRRGLVSEMLGVIERTPPLWALASNPYLLTLFCEVVFYRKKLPDPVRCSPSWVLEEAVNLMIVDHNTTFASEPLSSHDEERLAQVAFLLCFGAPEKRTTFDPSRDMGVPFAQFVDSALARSRFFNAFRDRMSTYEFSHLRLQEFLAARQAVVSGFVDDVETMKRYLLSSEWREESRFIGAHMAQTNRNAVYWQLLTDILHMPDHAGELTRRIAGILAAAGTSDGGQQLLASDVREILWNRISPDEPLVEADLRALTELDPEYLLNQTLGGKLKEERLLENVYRLLPLQMRKSGLHDWLRNNPMYSWVIGLPARAFPTESDLQELLQTAVDIRRSAEERIDAIRDLGSARASGCVNNLVPLLGDANEDIASATAETLGKIGGRAAAMAVATRVCTPTTHAPGLLAALLNALTIEGYGIIEPHSRDLILAKIERCAADDSLLEILLGILARTPIPNPPRRILEILCTSTIYPAKTRISAAEVFAGITDESFLTEALNQLVAEKDQEVRTHLLREVPFIPPLYENIDTLWAYCESPTTSQAEKTFALLLFVRTIRRFPNHDAGAKVRRYLREQLLALANGKRIDVERHVMRNAPLIAQDSQCAAGQEIKSALLSIVRNQRLQDQARAEAASILARFSLADADIIELHQQFDDLLADSNSDSALVISLVETLSAVRPLLTLTLLYKAESVRTVVGQAARSAILQFTHRHGYLLLGNRVIGPDGNPVGETA